MEISLILAKNMDSLDGDEKTFYQDQLLTRKCRISEAIDVEYEAEREASAVDEALKREMERGEIDFMEDVESCMPDLNSTLVLDSSIITNQSVNRSGLVWVSVSTNEAVGPQVRNFSVNINYLPYSTYISRL